MKERTTSGPLALLREAGERLDRLSAGQEAADVRASFYRAFARLTTARLYLHERAPAECLRIIDLALGELNEGLSRNPKLSDTVTEARRARREVLQARRAVAQAKVWL